MQCILLSSNQNNNFNVIAFNGYEGISKPYQFIITVTYQQSLEINSLLGTSITLKINGIGTRYINGIIRKINIVDSQTAIFTIASWLSQLAYIDDNRIFHNKSAAQIFSTVCQELGCFQYDLSQLSEQQPIIPYVVQHHETDLTFLQRILSQAGLYFYFQHTKHSHIMILRDNSHSMKLLPQSLVWNKKTELHNTPSYSTTTNDYTIEPCYQIDDKLLLNINHKAIINPQEKHYKNDITATPAYLFKPAIIKANQLPGINIATINRSDEKITANYDWNHRPLTTKSLPTLQPYTNKRFTTQFKPKLNDRVIIHYQQGDPNQPIINGTLTSKATLANQIHCYNDNHQIMINPHAIQFKTQENMKISSKSQHQINCNQLQIKADTINTTSKKHITLTSNNNTITIKPNKITIQANLIDICC